jgi:hypothetical protein
MFVIFKETLKESEIELAGLIETKINSINDLKTVLLKEKFQEEVTLKVTSMKFVMEKVSAASLKWTKEEYEKQLEKLRQEEQERNGMFF